MFIMGDLSVSLSILFLHFVKMRNRSAAIRAGNRRMEWDGGAVGQGDRFGVPVWRDEARHFSGNRKIRKGMISREGEMLYSCLRGLEFGRKIGKNIV